MIIMVRHHSFILWEEPCEVASVTAPTITPHTRCCRCGFPRIVTQWEGFALWKIYRRTFYHVIQHFIVLGNYVRELLHKYLTTSFLIWEQTFLLSFQWQNNYYFCNNLTLPQHLATKYRAEGEKMETDCCLRKSFSRICIPDNSQSIKIHSNNNRLNPLMLSNQRALFPLALWDLVRLRAILIVPWVKAGAVVFMNIHSLNLTRLLSHTCKHTRVDTTDCSGLEHFSHTICETTQTLLT